MLNKRNVLVAAVGLALVAFLLSKCSGGGKPPAPPEPPSVLGVSAGEAPVGVVLKDRGDLQGITVGITVDVLVLPPKGGPVLIVSGRVIALNERERTAVVAVPKSDAGKLSEQLKAGRPMLAVRAEAPVSASASNSNAPRKGESSADGQ